MLSRKRSQKKNWSIPGPFSPILYDELDSAAYQELTPNAAKALPYFKRIHGKLIKKTDEIHSIIFDFTYSEAGKFGFARATFARVIDELHAKGFIDIVQQGGKRGCGMSNTKYRLSDRWRDFGKSVFMKRPRYPSEPPKIKARAELVPKNTATGSTSANKDR